MLKKNLDGKLSNKIKVKVLSKIRTMYWLKQFPDNRPVWGNCEFIFDKDCSEYDWLVVYDDLPSDKDERFSTKIEDLACSRENTLLVTCEPQNIKIYGQRYVEQFGHVLTSHDDKFLKHPNKIFSQQGLIWFYGFSYEGNNIEYNELLDNPPLKKSKRLSTVCSNKQQKHTLHNLRNSFTGEIEERVELDRFGLGVKPMDDKSEAMKDYKYHIAIENFIGEHHWTEKLSDCFLAATLPFYSGATNVQEYFPKDSFIYIDIYDVDKSVKIIENAMKNNEYEKRLPAILQARDMVLKKYNFFAVVADIINNNLIKPKEINTTERSKIMSRRAIMGGSISGLMNHGIDKMKFKYYNFMTKKEKNIPKYNWHYE